MTSNEATSVGATTSGNVSVNNKSVWKMTLESFSKADNGGKTKKSDRIANTQTEALRILKDMILNEKTKEMEKQQLQQQTGNNFNKKFLFQKHNTVNTFNSRFKNLFAGAAPPPATPTASDNDSGSSIVSKWDLPWTPMKELHVTYEEVLISFCKWARCDIIDEEEDDSEAGPKVIASSGTHVTGTLTFTTPITRTSSNSSLSSSGTRMHVNVSKAFRRLENYVTWMQENKEKLQEPLTIPSIKNALHALGIRLTHSKTTGHLLWWVDIQKMDIDSLQKKKIPVLETVRSLIWLSHITMLDKGAQENGIIIIENLAKIGFFKIASIFPMDVKTQLNKMTIGCLPIKMKKIYILDAANWTNVILGFMKPFMSKKMRLRIVVIKNNTDATNQTQQEIINNVVGGEENILADFVPGLDGKLEKDIIYQKYLSIEEETQ